MLHWLIPDMLPEGLVILAGKPKQGKTRLAHNIAMALAQGGHAMGAKQVERCDVLFLALEDSERRLQRRAAESNAWPEAMRYAIEWERGNTDALRDVLKKFPLTRYVVIDTYGQWKPPAAKGANAYEDDSVWLKKLKAVADDCGITVMIIHHTRKAEAVDILDELLGSTGIAAGVDSIWILKRPRGEKTGELHVIGREMEDTTYAIEWDATLLSYKLLGKVEEVNASDERDKVLDALRPMPLRIGQLTLAIGRDKTKVRGVRYLLDNMIRDGQVTKTGDQYRVAAF